jgi:predicted acetyltransferase
MPELIVPTSRLEDAWRASHDEWGPGTHEDGFGLLPEDDVSSPTGFATWLSRLAEQANPASHLGNDKVHCTYRWIIEDEQVVGGIALRHNLSEFLRREGGHIGYGIRPSARRRGLAQWALRQMLLGAHKLKINEVLIVCADDNFASARTIESCGGVLDDILDTERGPVRRYWVKINHPERAT